MTSEDLSDDAIYASANEPARDDQGRFAAQDQDTRQDTRPAEQEAPTPNLGQMPDQGGDRGDQGGQEQQPADPWAREKAGILADLKRERERATESERLRAERDRAYAEMQGRFSALQQMMQGQQSRQQPQAEPPKAPDPFEDPQGFAAFQADQVFRQRFQPFADQSRQQQEQFQRVLTGLQRSQAVSQFGADLAREAEDAFNTAAARNAIDPHEWQRIQSADNPYAAAVEWHQRQQTVGRVGNDPDKWFASEFERRAKSDPAFQQQMFALLNGQAQPAAGGSAPAAGQRAPVFIPSLNGSPGAAARGQGPISEDDIYDAAPARMGGRRG